MSVRDPVPPPDPSLEDVQQVRAALEESARELRALTSQLQEERARLVEAQSVAKVGSWHTDIATQRLTWSAETYRIFETTPADFEETYAAFLERVHPDDRASIDQALSQSMGQSTASIVEHRILLDDDRIKFVEERWLVTHDDQGRPKQAVGTCRDITDQKLAEARIERLNRVHAVLSGIDHVIVREKDPGSMLAAACRIAVEKGRFQMAWIAQPVPNGQLAISAHAGVPRDVLDTIERVLRNKDHQLYSLARQALVTGEHQVVNDIARDPRTAGWGSAALWHGCLAVASLPLIAEGMTVGTLNLCADQRHAFDDDEIRLLDGLASEIAFALEVYRRDAERHLAEAALRTSEARLRESLTELHEVSTRLNDVREQERARMARDIHDHLGQALTALKMDLMEVKRRIASGDAKAVDDRLNEMAELIDSSTNDVRRVAAELRPVILDDLGFVLAIKAYLVDVERRANLKCVLATDLSDLPIAADRATALFRILQEALTNALRHAAAGRVVVTLTADAHTVRLVIHDDGRGITAAEQRNPRAIGLVGMRDRARLFGGVVAVTGGPGEGTTVAAQMPLSEDPR